MLREGDFLLGHSRLEFYSDPVAPREDGLEMRFENEG